MPRGSEIFNIAVITICGCLIVDNTWARSEVECPGSPDFSNSFSVAVDLRNDVLSVELQSLLDGREIDLEVLPSSQKDIPSVEKSAGGADLKYLKSDLRFLQDGRIRFSKKKNRLTVYADSFEELDLVLKRLPDRRIRQLSLLRPLRRTSGQAVQFHEKLSPELKVTLNFGLGPEQIDEVKDVIRARYAPSSSFEWKPEDPCAISESEYRLLQEIFEELPEVYSREMKYFRLEKGCTPLLKAEVIHQLTRALDQKFGWSKQRSFRDVNAWYRKRYLFLRQNPAKAEGSYSPQGHNSPADDLATSAEGYFSDSRFICRHPAMYAWFYVNVGPSLVESSDCPDHRDPVDPRKVTQVGYILARPKDGSISSGFGHSLLHFHDGNGDTWDDLLIQAIGHPKEIPVITGFEAPFEIAEKRKITAESGITPKDMFLRGMFGQLDLRVVPAQYRHQWLENVVSQGRDFDERLLKLSPQQIRILSYIINNDIQKAAAAYDLQNHSCSSYAGEVLNKAVGETLIPKNWYGVHTPTSVYAGVKKITTDEFLTQGYRNRLLRLVPERTALFKTLRDQNLLDPDQLNVLSRSKNPKEIQQFLEQLYSGLEKRDSELNAAERESLGRFLFTYTAEHDSALRRFAQSLYRDLFDEEIRFQDDEADLPELM